MENYTIVTKLGKGACGEVFLVRHSKSNKLAALKTIQLDENRKNRTKSAVLREAKILAQLKHPNIVAYHDSFFNETDEHLCIVQDYCDGGTLDDKIQDTARKKEFLGEKQIMQWFIQITMAVQYMHSQKVLHRDLKTQNVFMNKGGTTCRLGDFGISKMMETTIDMASTCVGTPCYLAPEMCQDIPYSSKADVWALGCLLYEMCGLCPAFDAKNLISLFYKIVKGDVDPLPIQYSDSIMQLIKTVLMKNPEERPSARQILVHPYVKEQMTDFIIELINVSEMREKELPANRSKRYSKSPVKMPKQSNSADSSPVSSRRHWNRNIDKTQLSQTFESAILLPIPTTPTSSKECEATKLKTSQSTTQSLETQKAEKQLSYNNNLPIGDCDKKKELELVNDPIYEDDFEDSNSEEDEDTPVVTKNRMADCHEEIPEELNAVANENQSDSDENEYEDDFEDYDSDEDLDGIVSYCKEYHDGENYSDDDEYVIDQEPSRFSTSCKNLLQEHAIQTLGKKKYSEIARGNLFKITEEDLKLTVEHKSGKEHLETCFLVSELLSETP